MKINSIIRKVTTLYKLLLKLKKRLKMGPLIYLFQIGCGILFVVEYSRFVMRPMNEDSDTEERLEKNGTINNHESSEPTSESSNHPLSTAAENVMQAHAELDQTPDSVPGFVQDDVSSPFPWKSLIAFGVGVMIGAAGVWFLNKRKASHKKDSETAVSSNLNENSADFSSVKNVTISSEKKSNGFSEENEKTKKQLNGVTKNNGVSLSNSNALSEKNASSDYSSSEPEVSSFDNEKSTSDSSLSKQMEKGVSNQLNKVVELQPNDQTLDGISTITEEKNAEFPWGLVFLTIAVIAGLIYGGVCVYEKI